MFQSNIFYVYILECGDTSFYTGMTNWLERRMEEHNLGKDDTTYTAQRLPLKLVYYEWHQYVFNAIKREKQIKNWSRAKKIALINGDFAELKRQSCCKNQTHFSNLHRDKPHAIINGITPKYAGIFGNLPSGSSNGFRENASFFLSLHYANQVHENSPPRTVIDVNSHQGILVRPSGAEG